MTKGKEYATSFLIPLLMFMRFQNASAQKNEMLIRISDIEIHPV